LKIAAFVPPFFMSESLAQDPFGVVYQGRECMNHGSGQRHASGHGPG
jgi:hypothetical protein